MSLIYMEIEKKADELEKFYKKAFKDLFASEPPNLESEDVNTLRWLVNQYPDVKQCEMFLFQYLRLDDDWVRGQGHPLRLLKRSLQAIIVSNAPIETKSEKVFWVVMLSETGRPVCSQNQYAMGRGYKFKPVLFDDWVKRSIPEKLQLPREKWEAVGNDVAEWIKNWQEWDFLHGDNPNITHRPMG